MSIIELLSRRVIFILLVFLVLLIFAPSARPATFLVTKDADTNDGSCDADCSLREAIARANLTPTNDEIHFDPVFFGNPRTIMLTNGGLVINNNGGLWINGPGAELLAISGNNAVRVMVVNNDARVVISAVTIRDGSGGAGGGIANLGDLALNSVVIRNNFGSPFGGGIANQSVLTIAASKIIENNGDLEGGGIHSFNSPAVLNVYETTISGNVARRAGAGIYNSGKATIVGSTISSNVASSPNDGGNGGGIHTTGYVNQASSVTVVNSTIADNVSRVGGGGISMDGSLVDLTNVTLTGNSVSGTNINWYGGGVLHYQGNYPGTARARNTIIADNTAANGQAPDFGGVVTSLGFNLIENTHWTTFTQPPQSDIFGQDPLLGPLSSNGGATVTRMPLAGSPVIDRVVSGSPETDQRYYSRPIDGDGNGTFYGDIGAVEAGSSAAKVSTRISGRVMSTANRGDYPGLVQLIDNSGNVRYAPLNQFGYYRFTDVLVGRTYLVRVVSKRKSYLPNVIFVTGSVDSLNFL